MCAKNLSVPVKTLYCKFLMQRAHSRTTNMKCLSGIVSTGRAWYALQESKAEQEAEYKRTGSYQVALSSCFEQHYPSLVSFASMHLRHQGTPEQRTKRKTPEQRTKRKTASRVYGTVMSHLTIPAPGSDCARTCVR